jgi:ribulose 1,5-bisphosphate synthetase/thiazole synthase
VAVYFKGNLFKMKNSNSEYPNVSNAQEVIVVGAGPAGLLPLCS